MRISDQIDSSFSGCSSVSRKRWASGTKGAEVMSLAVSFKIAAWRSASPYAIRSSIGGSVMPPYGKLISSAHWPTRSASTKIIVFLVMVVCRARESSEGVISSTPPKEERSSSSSSSLNIRFCAGRTISLMRRMMRTTRTRRATPVPTRADLAARTASEPASALVVESSGSQSKIMVSVATMSRLQ